MAAIQGEPILITWVNRQLIARLKQTEALLTLSSTRPIAERLRQVLLLLAEEFGQPESRSIRLPFRLTHKQLASAIGTTRVTVTHLLNDLQDQGWLSIPQRQIILTNPVNRSQRSEAVCLKVER